MKKTSKKILAMIAAIIMMLSIIPFAFAFASDDYDESGNYYYITVDGNAVIVGLVDRNVKTAVVPEELEGCPVTAIGSDSYGGFAGLEKLESVTLPSTLKTIHDGAFANCIRLKSITIPDGVTDIGVAAFAGCYSLSAVRLPRSLKNLGDYAFEYCMSLRSASIESKDVVLGEYSLGYTAMALKSGVTIETVLDIMETEEGDIEDYLIIYDDIEKIDGFVIAGYSNSTAQAYAEENGFSFLDFENPSTDDPDDSSKTPNFADIKTNFQVVLAKIMAFIQLLIRRITSIIK